MQRNFKYGDDLTKPREVRFELVTDSRERVEQAGELINSCGYGNAIVTDDPSWSLTDETDAWRVIVIITMPVTPPELQSISALMLFVAERFGLSYEGWACQLKAPRKL